MSAVENKCLNNQEVERDVMCGSNRESLDSVIDTSVLSSTPCNVICIQRKNTVRPLNTSCNVSSSVDLDRRKSLFDCLIV